MAARVKLYLKFGPDHCVSMLTPTDWTVDQLKAHIERKTGHPPDSQRLICGDAADMMGLCQLSCYGIKDGSVIHVVVGEQLKRFNEDGPWRNKKAKTRRRRSESRPAVHEVHRDPYMVPHGFEPS